MVLPFWFALSRFCQLFLCWFFSRTDLALCSRMFILLFASVLLVSEYVCGAFVLVFCFGSSLLHILIHHLTCLSVSLRARVYVGAFVGILATMCVCMRGYSISVYTVLSMCSFTRMCKRAECNYVNVFMCVHVCVWNRCFLNILFCFYQR